MAGVQAAERLTVAGGRRLSVVRGGPPHDLEAEEALLGAMLLSRGAATAAIESVGPGDFYRPAHGHVFAAIARLVVEGRLADPVTVGDELRRMGVTEVTGADLIGLQVLTPSPKAAEHYAEIVVRHAEGRRQLDAAAGLLEALKSGDEVTAGHLRAELAAGPSSWRLEAEDVAGLMRLGAAPVEAEILRRVDGRGLFVRGSLISLHGEPSAGKSFLLVEAASQVMTQGETAVVVDYEGSPRTMAERLCALDVDADLVEKHLRYLRPGPIGLGAVARVVADYAPALVVVDSFAAALGNHGDRDEDEARDVLWLLKGLCRPLTDAGACVVVVDHVTKSKETRRRWSRGSGAKIGEVDSAFSLEMVEPFSRDRTGSSELRVSKPDRGGAVGAQGEVMARVLFGADVGGRFRVSLLAPQAGGVWEGPTDCMEAILEILQARDGEHLSTHQMESSLRAVGKKFRSTVIREAAERLAADPAKPVTVRTGPRRARLFSFSPCVVDGDEGAEDF